MANVTFILPHTKKNVLCTTLYAIIMLSINWDLFNSFLGPFSEQDISWGIGIKMVGWV